MRKFPQIYTDSFIIGQIAIAQAIGWLPTSYMVAKWLQSTPATAQRHIERLVYAGYLTYAIDGRHKRGAMVADVTEDGMAFLEKNKTIYAGYLIFLFKVHADRKGYKTYGD